MTDVSLLKHSQNGTLFDGDKEGLLYLTLSHSSTLEEKKGTVCGEESIDINTAKLFCEAMGYPVRFGVWGSQPEFKYVPRFLVAVHFPFYTSTNQNLTIKYVTSSAYFDST